MSEKRSPTELEEYEMFLQDEEKLRNYAREIKKDSMDNMFNKLNEFEDIVDLEFNERERIREFINFMHGNKIYK